MTQNFRDPLKQVKGLGSAKDGTGHWIAQRLSSIVVAFLGLIIIGWLSQNYRLPYSEMVRIVGNPWGACVIFLFVASASYHAALGLQVIVEDYIHSPFWRYWLLMKIRLTGYILPVVTLFILIQLMFMGSK
ncbi:MAG: succinate dehydrogenase, hydrophobic membrane anchor protein [Candidatus Paracaedibacteraceae bacterium]|nr:succinate dehydrogenase, hydrophobic membrane anchor protein [Candidatus Paracaedibacteraceae bacterium]